MEIRNTTVESFLKGFGFSVLLCLYCGFFAVVRAREVLRGFDFFELLHFVFNVTVALLFLVRRKPAVVSMNLMHWMVAVITSCSGFLFVREGTNSYPVLVVAGDALISVAAFLALGAALILGRSFGFLPALRRVKTQYVYQIVRHPMYLSSIILRLGYLLKNPSIYNLVLCMALIVLYDKRAKYEEQILSHDRAYVDYLRRVKYRFVPGIY
ncbi:MAG: methyltransferase family protein [Planctomycetota bacterium]|jgi:protein-S-isoprenylcysteine O-methyltransferase Ste14